MNRSNMSVVATLSVVMGFYAEMAGKIITKQGSQRHSYLDFALALLTTRRHFWEYSAQGSSARDALVIYQKFEFFQPRAK